MTRALVPRQELAAGLRALAEERVPEHEVGYKKDHHAGIEMIAMASESICPRFRLDGYPLYLVRQAAPTSGAG